MDNNSNVPTDTANEPKPNYTKIAIRSFLIIAAGIFAIWVVVFTALSIAKSGG